MSQEVINIIGRLYRTFRITVGDASALLTALVDAANGGAVIDWTTINAVFISCEDYAVRWAVGGAAGTGVNRLGPILYVGQTIRFANRSVVQNLHLINETAGSAGVLMVAIEK